MNRRAKKANILFVRCTGKSVLCCRLAVALFLAVLLLGCQTAPRDLHHESLRLPRFKNYYGADESVVHFVLTPDPWRRPKSVFEKTTSIPDACVLRKERIKRGKCGNVPCDRREAQPTRRV